MSTLIDGTSALGVFRNDINNLLNVSENCYENIFRMYSTTNSQYFYNILNNVCLPNDLSPSYFYVVKLTRKTAWTVISYNEYKTMNLWWLICIVNNIQNPIDYPVPGTQLKIIYPQYVKNILDEINTKINL
jgi:hypothetical protein